MIRVGDGKRDQLAKRIEGEFQDARDDLVDMNRAIIADMSSKGGAIHGATIKRMIAAASSQGEVATKSALEAFERACTHPLVSRRDLKGVVKTEVQAGVEALHKDAVDQLEHLGFDKADLAHAEPLASRAVAKAMAALDAHFDGWTGPALSWAKRHPGWMAVGSFGAGILAGDFLQIIGLVGRVVSPLFTR